MLLLSSVRCFTLEIQSSKRLIIVYSRKQKIDNFFKKNHISRPRIALIELDHLFNLQIVITELRQQHNNEHAFAPNLANKVTT